MIRDSKPGQDLPTYYIGVRSGMAQPLDLPLPEITTENFTRAWIRFELVAKAKEWDAAKQLTVLPTLLRGKLLDHFVDCDDDTKSDLKKLHAALIAASGLLEDPLSAAKSFIARDQRPDEKVADFASAIKKLFRQAYPEERAASKVLLQRFLTGLRAPISQQLLLRGRPDQLEKAIKDATEVEYALNFDRARVQQQVNAMSERHLHAGAAEFVPKPDVALQKLQTALDAMTKRMETLEATLTKQMEAPRRDSHPPVSRVGVGRRNAGRRPPVCYLCGQEGHIKRTCPLNFAGPARMAGSWPGPLQ